MSDPREGRSGDSVARVRVTIDGEAYVLRSPEGAEHVQRCAALVDARIREVRAQGARNEPPHRVALLAALSLAYDIVAERAGGGDEALAFEMILAELESLVSRVEGELNP